MANTPRSATPVAPGVDPIEPRPVKATPAPAPTETQNDKSAVLNKEDDSKALPGNGATDETQTVKVKTKEDITLMDPFSAKHIDINGATVPVTSFINDELEEGGRLEKA